jgi:hypothetical protein
MAEPMEARLSVASDLASAPTTRSPRSRSSSEEDYVHVSRPDLPSQPPELEARKPPIRSWAAVASGVKSRSASGKPTKHRRDITNVQIAGVDPDAMVDY